MHLRNFKRRKDCCLFRGLKAKRIDTMKSSTCPFTVTAASCLFLCITVSLSMLCISLWLTSQGLTNYVESMKYNLQKEGQIGKRGSAHTTVGTSFRRRSDRDKTGSVDSHLIDDAFSDSWLEVRKHRTRLLTRTKCLQDLFLIIIVSSSPEANKNRMVIRHTWGTDNALHRKWKTVFLIGEASSVDISYRISREAQIFGDIIQGDYPETFTNKVFKIESGFEWAAKYCSFKYLLKTDDDVFVNTRGLIEFLTQTGTANTDFYFGHLMHGNPVLRHGFYGVSEEDHPENTYKDYISGGGYVLSRDLVLKLIPMFDIVKPLKVDDAYIGILAADLGVQPISSTTFLMYNDKKSCKDDPNILLIRPIDHDCMVKLFDDTQMKLLSQSTTN